jgi:hypothetical protein
LYLVFRGVTMAVALSAVYAQRSGGRFAPFALVKVIDEHDVAVNVRNLRIEYPVAIG